MYVDSILRQRSRRARRREMREVYSISIERAGLADLPELVRCESAEVAGAIVMALLSAHDPAIQVVHVRPMRIVE
jgi:hypothetical protein